MDLLGHLQPKEEFAYAAFLASLLGISLALRAVGSAIERRTEGIYWRCGVPGLN